MKGRVLIIAGSDSSGGAGVQADIKTVTVLGGYAATAITAVTVQSTEGVKAVHQLPPEIAAGQIDAVLDDIGADAIKIGMIGDLATAEVIEAALKNNSGLPVVLDPVMVATSGDGLAADGVARFLRDRLVPLATVVTPNLAEAEALTGLEDQEKAAQQLVAAGATAALVKGGHGMGNRVTDCLYTEGTLSQFENLRLNTRHTHGTGCTLASAIAVRMAQGLGIKAACSQAIGYVHEAIRTAPGFGAGHGPLNHGHVLSGK